MIVRPKLFLLFIFGLVALLAILIVFYYLSLPFFRDLSTMAIFYVWLPMFAFTGIMFFFDLIRKTKLMRYAFTVFISLGLAYLIFPSIKSWIVKNTESRGNRLVKDIQSYQLRFGHLPKSLDDPFFKESPKTAIINRPFFYKLLQSNDNKTYFSISCYSFDGNIATRYLGDEEWKYSD